MLRLVRRSSGGNFEQVLYNAIQMIFDIALRLGHAKLRKGTEPTTELPPLTAYSIAHPSSLGAGPVHSGA